MKQSKLAYCVLLALATSSQAKASEQTEKDINYFDTVVVTASKTAQRLGDVDGSIAVISEQDMQRNIVESVDDLFKYTPSVTVGNGSRGEKPINIRGITGNRVLTMVDGVKQAKNLSWGSLNSSRHFVDPNTLKSVEVLTSPASSLYGSDALGGVVAYATKDPSDLIQEGQDFGTESKLSYNSANEGSNFSVGLAGRAGNTESLLIMSRRQGKETENTGKVGGTGPTREKADPKDSEDRSILAKVKLKGDQQNLTLTGEYLDSDTFTTDLSSSNANANFDEDEVRKRVSAEYEFNRQNRAFDKMTAKLDWQTTETDQLQRYDRTSRGVTAPYSYDADYDERVTALSLYFDKSVQSGNLEHNIKYGISAEKSKFEQIRTSSLSGTNRAMPLTESESFAAFAQDQIDVNDKLTVTPGIRFDKYTINPKPDQAYLDSNPPSTTLDKNDESRTSFKLGATYDISPNVSMFGQFAQGFKSPDMKQMFANYGRRGAYNFIANEDLKPETSDSFELGTRYDNGKVNAEAVAFYNKYDNFIDQVRLANDPNYPFGVFQQQNLTGVKIKGLEVKGAVKVNNNVKVKGAIAYAEGTYESNGETKPLNSIAPLHGTVGVAYDANNKNWGTELSVTAAKGKEESKVDNANTFRPGGFGVVDLTAYKKLGKNVRLDAGIFNVGDKRYWEWETARSYNSDDDGLVRRSEAGRHFKAAVTWSF